jgi:protein-S-isoprenylcysteine O-methyltransferase Ste14
MEQEIKVMDQKIMAARRKTIARYILLINTNILVYWILTASQTQPLFPFNWWIIGFQFLINSLLWAIRYAIAWDQIDFESSGRRYY